MTDFKSQNSTASMAGRLVYIDNLRIFLTILVVLQHVIVAYGGGSGQWYYNDLGKVEGVSWYVMTYIWLLNQSFFMGFLFMLSSYFTPSSYDKKGGGAYFKDRLKRLGIPFVIYIALINPVLSYCAWVQKAGFKGNFLDFLPQYFQYYSTLDAGVIWFVEVLLIFSLIYAIWEWFAAKKNQTSELKSNSLISVDNFNFPSNSQIVCFGLILGILSFLDRMLLHNNLVLQILGLPKGHFVQYIAFLVLGVLTYRYDWIVNLTKSQGIFWTRVTIGLALLLPGILIYAGTLNGYFSPYATGGGWNWASVLIFAIWEQFICISTVITLAFWFREGFANQSSLTKAMARNTYAVYIVHTPIVTLLVFAFRDIQLYPLLKFMLVAPVTIVACFLIGHIVRTLPFSKGVL